MAESAGEKTEPATPRRRRDARAQGEVARSQDLTAAVLLLSGFLALALVGPSIWQGLLDMTRAALTGEPVERIDDLLMFAAGAAVEAAKRILPFLLILFVATLLALIVQIGFLFTWKPLTPSLSKISPLRGIKKLLSVRSIMLAVINFGKLLVVGAVVYVTLKGSAAAIVFALNLGFETLFSLGSALMFDLGMRVGLAMLILALLDFAWQKFKHERDLRMTKEEVKDELRSMEGDPKMKARRRDVQLQLAMQRLRKDVPTADVIVTNPTHVAVAISYNAETMSAPKVVSKGGDYVALRIRHIAEEFGIPIVARPPLARALFENVDIGGYVPERLYKAIAEVLAYVYELSGRSPAKASPALV